jgi:hypothetical protein
MLPHTETINHIIQVKGFKSYLEIGVHDPYKNFDQIKCQFKIGVDPNGKASFTGTSDEFFKSNRYAELQTDTKCGIEMDYFIKQTFDCIFIDGLHHYDQVKRDFENAMACLNDGGIILIHDTNPAKEEYACVPRNGLKGRWNGDVYKIIPVLRRSSYDYITVDYEANGLTIVKPKKRIAAGVFYGDRFYMGNDEVNSYKEFDEHRKEIMNLVTRQQLDQWIL